MELLVATFLFGIIFGICILLVLMSTKPFKRELEKRYYDEFVYQLSRLPKPGFEKFLENLRNSYEILSKVR